MLFNSQSATSLDAFVREMVKSSDPCLGNKVEQKQIINKK